MKRLALALSLSLCPLHSPVHAQDLEYGLEETANSRASQIELVLKGKLPAEAVFSPLFLAEVPASQLERLVSQLVEQNGPVIAVDEVSYNGNGAADFDIVFQAARATASLQLDRDDPHQVAGFRIFGATPIDDTPQRILADFADISGQNGFGVYLLTGDGPQPVLTQGSTRQLAIGSTFKLYVLSALAHEVQAGKRRWSDVITLGERSIPSGQMQDWPAHSPVTLHTLATMMISVSDNTATDALMRLIGREALAAEIVAAGHSEPSRTLPLLTTIELFALKTGDPARIDAYAAADDAGQTMLLEEWAPTLTREHVDIGKLIGSNPNAIESVEWFASAEDIARLFIRLRSLGDPALDGILSVNPSMTDRENAHWAYAGYKGGSEPGVLNFSWLLQDRQNHWFAISVSWNDPAAKLDHAKREQWAMRLLAMLHRD